MNIKKWNRVIAGIVVVLLALTNSLTVLVYVDAVHETY